MAKGSAAIQALYGLCNKTFTRFDAQPSSQSVRRLCSLMDTIGPSDLGLKEDILDDDRGHGFFEFNSLKSSTRTAQWAQPITYLHVYECDRFTIGIFCLPTSSVIPLHDHPGMIVLSKILYGSMHVKAYDWVEPPCIMNRGRPSKISDKAWHSFLDTLSSPSRSSSEMSEELPNLHAYIQINKFIFYLLI